MDVDTFADRLKELVTEREELNEEADNLAQQSMALRKLLVASRQRNKFLEAQIRLLEQQPCVLDGIDEEWLWANQAELRFKRRLGVRSRVLVIKARGRKKNLFQKKDGGLVLKEAMEAVSARTRGSEEREDQEAEAECPTKDQED